MPIRIRITLLFTLLVLVILGLVCTSVYYFSYTSSVNTIKARLKNRAITIGGLLSQSDIFSNNLIQRIDSSTLLSLINKVIQAYDYKNNKIYSYSNVGGDKIEVGTSLLDAARINGSTYFTVGEKEAIAYHYTNRSSNIVIVAAAEDPEAKKNLRRLLNILLLSFSGGVATAFFGGYFFSKGLLHPIKKIADDVNEISAQNISRRIGTGKARDEWYYLSNTLNDLLNRLQESFDLQKHFIANASHELSTPLTSISSQLEVSLQRERAADDYRLVMTSIHQDVVHMIKLTQTLLEFAKASGTPGGLEIALVRIDEVLFRLPSEVAKVNSNYSVLFKFDQLPSSEDALLVFGNEELLFTAIKNIVINACKYSEDHQSIIQLKTEGENIFISVKDTGIGIPDAELKHIFQPFYRVNDERTSEGFGLGLSLAYRIIKLHKGQIEVQSTVGEGSTFTIMFPTANLRTSG